MEGNKIDGASILVGFLAGAAVGGVLSYILARRSFNARFDTELNAEVDAVRDHYHARAKAARDRIDTLERSVPAVAERLGQPGVVVGFPGPVLDGEGGEDWPGNSVVDELMADPEFAVADVSLDVPWPPANRDRTKPYVISDAEFAEGSEEDGVVHQCITIKWYNDDQILVDDRNEPIPDLRRTTGPLSRNIFGGVSGDPNIAYIRNERLQVDFEVCFDERSYIDAVLHYGNPNPGTGSIL